MSSFCSIFFFFFVLSFTNYRSIFFLFFFFRRYTKLGSHHNKSVTVGSITRGRRLYHKVHIIAIWTSSIKLSYTFFERGAESLTFTHTTWCHDAPTRFLFANALLEYPLEFMGAKRIVLSIALICLTGEERGETKDLYWIFPIKLETKFSMRRWLSRQSLFNFNKILYNYDIVMYDRSFVKQIYTIINFIRIVVLKWL